MSLQEVSGEEIAEGDLREASGAGLDLIDFLGCSAGNVSTSYSSTSIFPGNILQCKTLAQEGVFKHGYTVEELLRGRELNYYFFSIAFMKLQGQS